MKTLMAGIVLSVMFFLLGVWTCDTLRNSQEKLEWKPPVNLSGKTVLVAPDDPGPMLAWSFEDRKYTVNWLDSHVLHKDNQRVVYYDVRGETAEGHILHGRMAANYVRIKQDYVLSDLSSVDLRVYVPEKLKEEPKKDK